MSDPKADCEALIGSVLPFAEQMLTTHGAFIPFGGAMRADGQTVSIAGYDKSEHSQSTNVIALMKDGFVEGARTGEYKATALVYDVRVEIALDRGKIRRHRCIAKPSRQLFSCRPVCIQDLMAES